MSRWLVISDLQIPFEHNQALDHCRYVQKQFSIPSNHILCVGDELDQYFGSLWKKNVNMKISAKEEIEISKAKLRKWYEAFPRMSLCLSNHGSRWMRKATEAEIPQEMIVSYQNIVEAPQGWRWARSWKVKSKYPFMMEHGDNWGGQFPHKNAALHNGISTVMGHHHTLAGVEFVKTAGLNVWGFVTGSLIDFESLAFEYAQKHKTKPQLGVGVIMDDGRWPLWVPL